MIRFPANEGSNPQTEANGNALPALHSTDRAEGASRRSGHPEPMTEPARKAALERDGDNSRSPCKQKKYVSGN